MPEERIVEFKNLDIEIQELIKESVFAREKAYVPYSKFKVGAALRCTDGSISTGCNVENAAYPVSICAEQVAITKAVSEGKRRFIAISVAAEDVYRSKFTSPCGKCRQMMAEFGDIPVFLSTPDMIKIQATSLGELLPFSFGLNNATEDSH